MSTSLDARVDRASDKSHLFYVDIADPDRFKQSAACKRGQYATDNYKAAVVLTQVGPFL
jgi:hypothetical protein